MSEIFYDVSSGDVQCQKISWMENKSLEHLTYFHQTSVSNWCHILNIYVSYTYI